MLYIRGETIKPIIVGNLVDIFVGELWRLDLYVHAEDRVRPCLCHGDFRDCCFLYALSVDMYDGEVVVSCLMLCVVCQAMYVQTSKVTSVTRIH